MSGHIAVELSDQERVKFLSGEVLSVWQGRGNYPAEHVFPFLFHPFFFSFRGA